MKREGRWCNVKAGIEEVKDIKQIPMDVEHTKWKVNKDCDGNDEMEKAPEQLPQQTIVDQKVRAPIQMSKLKDLFAPQEGLFMPIVSSSPPFKHS